jgi:RHS repeat-associated protein
MKVGTTLVFMAMIVVGMANVTFGYYNQSLGRWTSEDPLGVNPAGGVNGDSFGIFRQYTHGLNISEYTAGDPVQRSDPAGLFDGFGGGTGSFGPSETQWRLFVDEYGIADYWDRAVDAISAGMFGMICGSEDSLVPPGYIPDGFGAGSWKVSFAKPCQYHDDCYACEPVSHFKNRTKADCDQQFKRRMRNVCFQKFGRAPWPVSGMFRGPLASCYALAEVYYQAVHSLGNSAFLSARNDKPCCTKDLK